MNLIYFGYYCDNQLFSRINTQDSYKLSQARQNFEELILMGLSQSFPDIDIYSYLPTKRGRKIESYSSINDKIIKLYKVDKNNPFSNIYNLLKILFLVAKFPRKSSIIMYAINPLFMIPLIILRPFKKFEITTICSELPQFRRGKENYFTRVKHKIQSFYNRKFDKYILITHLMKDVIPVKNKPYLVIEGMVPYQEKVPKIARSNDIMYAGALTPDNLIINFIEASLRSLLVDKILIFGEGPEEKRIKKLAETHNKIVFFGYKKREEILEYEKSVGVLISLRNIEDSISKYAFPSKLMEYMLSGTLILSTKIEGIPDEYDQFIDFTENVEPNSLAKKIDDILSLDDETYFYKSLRQQDFILEQKNFLVQTLKIAKLINTDR